MRQQTLLEAAGVLDCALCAGLVAGAWVAGLYGPAVLCWYTLACLPVGVFLGVRCLRS
jgi:hypothetical protein